MNEEKDTIVKKRYFSKSEVKHLISNFELNRLLVEKNRLREIFISHCKSSDDDFVYPLKWERVSVVHNEPEFFGQISFGKKMN